MHNGSRDYYLSVLEMETSSSHSLIKLLKLESVRRRTWFGELGNSYDG
jgi:hypothetical protein